MQTTSKMEDIRCHGFNSMKDVLSMTRNDCTTGIGSSNNSPSRFKAGNVLNQSSGCQLNVLGSGIIEGEESRSNLAKRKHRRPKTGVVSTKRNN